MNKLKSLNEVLNKDKKQSNASSKLTNPLSNNSLPHGNERSYNRFDDSYKNMTNV